MDGAAAVTDGQSSYLKFRGKCREMSEALAAENPNLTVVRGWYWDAFWGQQPHWWCKDQDGNIVDPTKKQFPDQNGEYEEFDGFLECSNCGKRVAEEDAEIDSNYAFCSGKCHIAFVLG